MTEKECKTCAYLYECKIATEKKLLAHHVCPDWRPANEADTNARADIEQEIGLWALRYGIHREIARAKPKIRRRKKSG